MNHKQSKLRFVLAYVLWGILFLVSLIFPFQLEYGSLVELLVYLAIIQIPIALIWFALLVIKKKETYQAHVERVFIFILMSLVLLFAAYLPIHLITHSLILVLIPLNMLIYLAMLKDVYLR